MKNNQLLVTKQESFGVDNFHNSQNKRVDLHFIAKNVPFVIVLESSQSISSEDLVEVFLVYEKDSSKVVEGIQKDAYSFIAHLIDSKHCSIEIRINALSSQHEGANFLLKFVIGELEAFSNPIKVLSKRTQIEKHLERVQSRMVQSTTAKQQVAPQKRKSRNQTFEDEEEEINNNNKNNNNNDQVIQLLRRLEQQQKEQKALLEKVASSKKKNLPLKKVKVEVEEQNNKTKPQQIMTSTISSSSKNFPELLNNFLKYWESLPSDSKQEQVQLAMNFLSSSQKESLENFLQCINHSNPSQCYPPLCYSGQYQMPIHDNQMSFNDHNFENFFTEFMESGDDFAQNSSPQSSVFESSPIHYSQPQPTPYANHPLISHEKPTFDSDEE